MSDHPRVSVIIPVHNDVDGLRATLDAIAAMREPEGGVEVIVADDRSTVPLAPVLAGRPNVRHVVSDGPRGSYGARNAGVRASRGELLAFTDADCEPGAGWLEAIVATLDARPEIVIAGAIRMPLGEHPTLAAMVDVTCHLDQQRYVENDGYAVTANVACTRATFERAGPFDEHLRSSGDREWTTRAQRSGAPLVYVEDAWIAHPPRATGGELWRKSKRVGRGGSALRRSLPPERRQRPNYLYKSWITPRHRERGLRRVRANGADPSAARWLLTGAAQLLYVQYPQVLYSLRSDVAAFVRSRLRTNRSGDRT